MGHGYVYRVDVELTVKDAVKMAHGWYSCVKYLMFTFNFLFWLSGCAILGVGIWVRADPEFHAYVDGAQQYSYLYTGAYILIAVGVVAMAIGFLGCCGAIRENQGMLVLFFAALFILLTLLLGTGIWAIVEKDALKKSVTETLRTAVRDYDNSTESRVFLDNIMVNFGCCGASGGAPDFMFYGKREDAPEKCELYNYGDPCDRKLFNFFSENLIVIAGVAIGVAVVMVLGMIFSMMLFCAIRNSTS